MAAETLHGHFCGRDRTALVTNYENEFNKEENEEQEAKLDAIMAKLEELERRL